MRAPEAGETWIALGDDTLPVEEAAAWVVRPDCGAVVVFSGTARDHSEGRPGVDRLSYEAFESAALGRMGAVADEARTRWPTIGRIALLHRLGVLEVGDSAVVVAVSAPHRDDAFDGARFAIDAVKATVPIWKRERWDGGDDFGLDAHPLVDVGRVGGQR